MTLERLCSGQSEAPIEPYYQFRYAFFRSVIFGTEFVIRSINKDSILGTPVLETNECRISSCTMPLQIDNHELSCNDLYIIEGHITAVILP